MSYELYKFLPTELVWEIYEHLHHSYTRDLNIEFLRYSDYIKRNCEDGFPIVEFISKKLPLNDECYNDEFLLEYYPKIFGDVVTNKARSDFFKLLNLSFDNFYFYGRRDYDMELYKNYDDFRFGDWTPELSWW
jgi:hypothetical protein